MGYQTNRMSIARTIFLAAQNQLTEKRITGNLREGSAYGTYDRAFNVYDRLGKPADWTDTGGSYAAPDGSLQNNTDVVQFISKAKGVGGPGDPVFDLLNPVVIDKSILNEAILIEYNIRAGVVLSAFYSDTAIADNVALGYTGTDNDSVAGTRPYGEHDARRQGYYGVRATGTLDEPLPESLIRLYDGASVPLPRDGITNASYIAQMPDRANALYAHIYLGIGALPETFGLSLDGMPTPIVADFAEIRNSGQNFTDKIYYIGDTADGEYAQFIWAIDYVNGDTTKISSNTIFDTFTPPPAPLAAALVMNPGEVNEVNFTSNAQLPYYYSAAGDKYTVRTARHLHNIRYHPNLSYQQDGDIDMTANGISYFLPLPKRNTEDTASVFTGSYSGVGYTIRNLKIDNYEQQDYVGLFSKNGGAIQYVTLENASVKGRSNIGGVAGQNGGTIADVKLADSAVTGIGYGTIRIGRSDYTAALIGGVTGCNNGSITDAVISGSSVSSSVTNSTFAFVGGVAGYSNGSVTQVDFSDTSVAAVKSYVGGVTGYTSGVISGVRISGTRNEAGKSTSVIKSDSNNVGGVTGESTTTLGVPDNTPDITVSGVNITGGYTLGGVAGILSGTVQNAWVDDCVISGSGAAIANTGGIAGRATGSVTDAVVTNSSVTSAGAQVGGIAGQSKAVNRVLVVNTTVHSGSAGGGNGGSGGIAGASNGSVANAVFIHSGSFVPISGTKNVGGIVGYDLYNNISDVIYLALAPQINGGTFEGHIVPITGLNANNSHYNDNRAYYLSGNPIRPAEAEINTVSNPSATPLREGYNLETVKNGNGIVIPLDTWEFYDMFKKGELPLGDGWTQYLGDKLERSDNVNSSHAVYVDEYPYPIISALSVYTPEDPFWPVALREDDATAGLFYAEMQGTDILYDDGLTGSIPDTYIVRHDSYGININAVNGEKTYKLTLGSEAYDIAIDANKKTVVIHGANTSEPLNWPYRFRADTDNSVRVFIPNSVAEAASGGADISVTLKSEKGKDILTPVTFNPAFASAAA